MEEEQEGRSEREGRAVIRSLLMLLRAPFVNVNDCDDGSGMKHFVAAH